MRKILLIIKREYLTRVRTKGFIIGTVIVPADRSGLHFAGGIPGGPYSHANLAHRDCG